MSSLARGFISDSRFGSGQVIKRANREVTRKWYALGHQTEGPQTFVKPVECSQCGAMCCNCVHCQTIKPAGICFPCSKSKSVR